MKKNTWMVCILLLSHNIFSQCPNISELDALFKLPATKQGAYLNSMGFEAYQQGGFGWDYKHKEKSCFIYVKTENNKVYEVQYRLLADSACFNQMLATLEAFKYTFTNEFIVQPELITQKYYKGPKRGIETKQWITSIDNQTFYQFNLMEPKYFKNEIKQLQKIGK